MIDFIKNIIGNKTQLGFEYSLNKQMMVLITFLAMFLPLFLTKLVWNDLDSPQKLTLIQIVLTYYVSMVGILVGAYSYNKTRSKSNFEVPQDQIQEN